MSVGLHALGIGTGARREIIEAVAGAAEDRRLATLWMGEHVVMVDHSESEYPYADDGAIPIPADADWLDPLIGLSFAGAATSRIRLATGVLLLPEHQALIVAKQAASLDVLTGGRLMLGVGIGWSREEFAALGVPFAGRARRTADYVLAMRTVWQDDVATCHTPTTAIDRVRVYPKPVPRQPDGRRQIPIILGGNSDAALERVASYGDGWYGFSLTTPQAEERLTALEGHCQLAGRRLQDLYIAVALLDASPSALSSLSERGVDEMVLVAEPPSEPQQVRAWLDVQLEPFTAFIGA